MWCNFQFSGNVLWNSNEGGRVIARLCSRYSSAISPFFKSIYDTSARFYLTTKFRYWFKKVSTVKFSHQITKAVLAQSMNASTLNAIIKLYNDNELYDINMKFMKIGKIMKTLKHKIHKINEICVCGTFGAHTHENGSTNNSVTVKK